ncbi:MAG: hypothetical protein WBZ42_05450 [Halobacteriota archaeon]
MSERYSDVDAMTPRERDYYLHASIRGYIQFLYTLDYGRRRLEFETLKDDEEYTKGLWDAMDGIHASLINAIAVLAAGLGMDAGTFIGEYLRDLELGAYKYEEAPEDIDDRVRHIKRDINRV